MRLYCSKLIYLHYLIHVSMRDCEDRPSDGYCLYNLKRYPDTNAVVTAMPAL